jgi:transglutaminase-like putative cysteine protease
VSDARAYALPEQRAAARRPVARLRAWLQPQVSIGVREQRDQALLLLAVAVAVVPHSDHLPLWSKGVLVGMWIWRAWLAQTLKPAPSRIVIVALLVLLTTLVWIEHGTLWGRDASVHFLLVLLGLKILEMRARRDVFVIVFLCLFVLETQFLFDQGPLTAAIMLSSVALLFLVLLSVSLPVGDISLRSKLRYLARVFILALPLTLAMFFLFPRLPAPMWNLGDSDQEVSASGLSEFMKPGSMRNLLRNDAIALRAKFEGPIPPQRLLYWRGPVFGFFDGDTWMPIESAQSEALEAGAVQVDVRSGVDYTVTLEPTLRRDLMGLEFTGVVDGVPAAQGRLSSTMELRSLTPVNTQRRYAVRSYTSYAANARASPESLADWRQLPALSNPRTRAWAAELKQRLAAQAPADGSGAPLDRRLADAVIDVFRKAPFGYNIQPGVPRGEDAIDEFLFETHIGYCEHYSSAFVFLMRAMDIPARVVTGYQGGEINPIDGFLAVRQSDAHAWAEVWLEHRGWVRYDPTAAVAPERVERTLRDLATEDTTVSATASNWLRRWRLDREALENAWNQWILSYSSERQRALVSWMGLRPNAQNIALVAAVAFTVLLTLLTLSSLRHVNPRDPLADLAFRIRGKLARAGVAVPANMGLQALETHLAGRLEPASLDQARPLLRALSRARYARLTARARAGAAAALRRRLRRWRVVRLRA